MNLNHFIQPLSFERRRESSWNTTGANKDHVIIEPGAAQVLADLSGPAIRHLWFTISSAQFGISHYERDITEKDRFYDGRFTLYRFHLSDPIPFRQSILVCIEHGHANDAAAEYNSVAYWHGKMRG